VSRRAALAAAVVLAAGAGAAALALAGSDPASQPAPSAAVGRAATLRPLVETAPVPNDGDAADDPAIWIHPRDPSLSTVVATDKQGGLAVYDLDGRQLQYLPGGRPDNVDLRAGFALGGARVALVAASDRSDDSVDLLRVDEATRQLVPVTSFRSGLEVYGICMYRSRRTGTYVFVDSKDGRVEQWRVGARGTSVAARRVRTFDAGGVVEGCVADDALGRLYVAEEDRGIWRYGAEPGAGDRRTLVDRTGAGGHLEADVEGLAIATGPRGTGHLVASSQGDDRFAVYRRGGRNAYLRSFRIGAAGGIDGASDTDGIDVTARPLGARFPRGLFVAQDGDNDGANQNFKLVPWRRWDARARSLEAARR
jgi:3-phytase